MPIIALLLIMITLANVYLPAYLSICLSIYQSVSQSINEKQQYQQYERLEISYKPTKPPRSNRGVLDIFTHR